MTSTNESTLDPETRLIVDSSSLTATSSSPQSVSSESAQNIFVSEATSTIVATYEDKNVTEMPPDPPTQIRARQSVIQRCASPIDYLRAVGDDPSMESDTEETGKCLYNVLL